MKLTDQKIQLNFTLFDLVFLLVTYTIYIRTLSIGARFVFVVVLFVSLCDPFSFFYKSKKEDKPDE